MRRIDLKTAIAEIKHACEDEQPSPFFFMVGAGISKPPLPLAYEIIAHCRERAATRGLTGEPKRPDNPIQVYDYWFREAYAQPANRRDYLKRLMKPAHISQANFRLAHLIAAEVVTKLIVTTNFDDFLSRALTLFGVPHVVCDHPNTVERIDIESSEAQIVHLHGTYWFYDCVNLGDEISTRSTFSSDTSFTMAQLVDQILWKRAPIVVGYSGWESDVFMSALKRRLSRPLRTQLYWFCFQEEDAERLPLWLKSASSVTVIAPEGLESQADSTPADSGDALAQDMKTASTDSRPTLPATAIFDALILKFALKPPLLTSDPLGFYADQLKKNLGPDALEKSNGDPYLIYKVVEDILKADAYLKAKPPRPAFEQHLDEIRNHLRSSDYGAAIQRAVETEKEFASARPEDLGELITALVGAGKSVHNDPEKEILAYDLVVRLGALLPLEENSSEPARICIADAMFQKANALSKLGRQREALDIYDELLRRFENASELGLRVIAAKSLSNKGPTSANLGRYQEALAILEQIVKRYRQPRRRTQGKKVKDISTLDEVPAPLKRQMLVTALLNEGLVLNFLGRQPEAIRACDDVLSTFSEDSEFNELVQVARRLRTQLMQPAE